MSHFHNFIKSLAVVVFSILGFGLLMPKTAHAQQSCPATVPAKSDAWGHDNQQNAAPGLYNYLFESWDEMKTAVEEKTVAYYLATGWTDFQMTYVSGPPDTSLARWEWSGIMPNGVPRSSSEMAWWLSNILVYTSNSYIYCPAGYTPHYYSGQVDCTLTNVNQLENCPDKVKPDKARGACPNGSNAMEGNPCNVATGNKFQQEIDYVGAGSSPVTYQRYYNSDSTTPRGSVGSLWRGYYDRSLVFGSDIYYQRMPYDYRIFYHNSPISSQVTKAYAHRPDGKIIAFRIYPTVEPIDGDTTERLTKVDENTWQLRNQDDEIETYKINADNLGFRGYASLKSIRSRGGVIQTLAYGTNGTLTSVTSSFGNTLSFTYDTSFRVSTMTDPAGGTYTYQYNSGGYLSQVTFPDGASKQYVYGDSANAGALTSIVDESNATYASWSYDSNRRAISSQHAGGVERVDFTFNSNGTTTVTDALGSTRVYTFGVVQNVPKTTSMLESGASRGASFGTNGFVQSRADKNGVQTTFTHDARGRETSRTEAFGTAVARTITTQWHADFDLPTQIDEPGRRTTFTHDATGNVLTKTELDTSTSEARTWTFTYNSQGQVLTMNGPRTDVSDVATYTYYNCGAGYQCGQVATITNAKNQTTTFNTYNAHGQPLTITDPNGLVTTLTYDPRQRLTSRTVGAEATTFEYWPTGLLKKATLADGSVVAYTYDAAHRLTKVADDEGNRIEYALDAMGNRLQEQVFDPASTLTNTHSRAFNSLSRLTQEIGAANTAAVTTTLGYDPQGNETSVNSPLGRNTAQAYDPLNRLTQVTDPASGVTQYSYNPLDQLISVNDPSNKATSYTYNAFDDVTQLVSPDTGTTTNTYDLAGNLKTKTDARSAVVTYSYDALNRVTQAVWSDQTIHYTYDLGTNGLGRLSNVSDNSGQTNWTYDLRGRPISRQQAMGSVSLGASFSYDSAGRVSIVSYPSGHYVQYAYANDKVASITLDGGASILTNVLYEPFGPVSGWTWGNSTLAAQGRDLDGKIDYIDGAGLRTYSYDDAFRITGITDASDASLSQSYNYDLLDRLTGATGTTLNQSWTYDPNGNRLTQGGSDPSTYTIASSSNRLTSVTGALTRTYTYDSAGNTLSDGSANFTYDQAGRMVSASKAGISAAYSINALGQRVRKTVAGVSTYFFYDESGRLMGEYDSSGNLLQELVWLGDTPVASIRPNAGGSGVGVFYIHTDHLGAPTKLTRPSDNAVVWRWDHDPFGNGTPNEDPDGNSQIVRFNLRFPGQYFDSETELSYNYFRDYDPATGRYVESDPIGLRGGLNTYTYVTGDPVNSADPTGEQGFPVRPAPRIPRRVEEHNRATDPNRQMFREFGLQGPPIPTAPKPFCRLVCPNEDGACRPAPMPVGPTYGDCYEVCTVGPTVGPPNPYPLDKPEQNRPRSATPFELRDLFRTLFPRRI